MNSTACTSYSLYNFNAPATTWFKSKPHFQEKLTTHARLLTNLHLVLWGVKSLCLTFHLILQSFLFRRHNDVPVGEMRRLRVEDKEPAQSRRRSSGAEPGHKAGLSSLEPTTSSATIFDYLLFLFSLWPLTWGSAWGPHGLPSLVGLI